MTAIHNRATGKVHEVQGVLPLVWADTRTKEQKDDDHWDMLREKAADRIRED